MEKLCANTQHDFQTWFNLTITGHFNQDSRDFGRFRYWLQGQERIGDGSRRSSQTIGVIGLGYDVSEHLSLWFAYSRIRTGIPFTAQPFNENRIWEQLIWNTKFKSTDFQSRTRMEQRFLENGTNTAYRVRQLFKFMRPFNRRHRLSLIGSDEIFWHKNDFIGQNGKGFDQNRLFMGFGYRLSPILQTEIGYMNQYVRRFGVPNFLNNALSINFFANF